MKDNNVITLEHLFRDLKNLEHTHFELANSKTTRCLDLITEIDQLNSLSIREKKKLKLTTKKQGDLLEELLKIILLSSNLFEVYQNIRTSTNEIDFVVSLSLDAKFLRAQRLIPDWIPDFFIIECKNYKGNVPVTYLGKFFSLMEINKCQLGIFISTNGITGSNSWRDASGFVKKVNLKHSELANLCMMLPIDLKSLKDCIVLDKGNIIKLFERAKRSIDLDNSNFLKYCNSHENEDRLSMPTS